MNASQVQLGRTWPHKLALMLVRPLAATPVTPNHLTWARLTTGIAACTLFASGERNLVIWGGWVWIVSALLDHADGELARLTGQISAQGHRFDMLSDMIVTSLFFVGGGMGLLGTELGVWGAIAGVIGGTAVLVAQYYAEKMDSINDDPDDRAYPGFAGFDFDNVLFLLALVAWFDVFNYFVLAAAFGAPLFAALTIYKWKKIESRDKT